MGENGGAKRDRTADLLRARQALSQLSYGPIEWWVWADAKDPGALTLLFISPQWGALSPTEREEWWVWADSNCRPHPYQGCALTN